VDDDKRIAPSSLQLTQKGATQELEISSDYFYKSNGGKLVVWPA